MATKVLRKIARIDEEKCNGCGACVPACAEGEGEAPERCHICGAPRERFRGF